MKKILKALAILLSCATVASVGGLMACDNEDFEYILSEDGTYYSISKYTGNDESVIIPSEYNGLPVKAVGRSAFRNNSTITRDLHRKLKSLEKLEFTVCLKAATKNTAR